MSKLGHTPLLELEDVTKVYRTGDVPVAALLVVRPSVVLADEPTGNLDSASAEEVLAVFERLNPQGATIVIVTHSHDVARRASRILRVADGLLVTDEHVDRAFVLEGSR